MCDIFKTFFTAIIGGIAVYYFPKWIKGLIYSNFKPILLYQFDDDGTGKGLRRVHHSFGETVTDKDASNGKAWEHATTAINDGQATCYGPYTKEIPFRGKYKARFRIKAINIKDQNATIIEAKGDVLELRGTSLNSKIT